MGGEPWCFTPTEIGLLTDRQIWDQYVKPAVDRQRAARRKPRRRRRRGEHDDGIPSKEAYVLMGQHTGKSREELEATYDAWAATDEAQAIFAKREENAALRRERRQARADA